MKMIVSLILSLSLLLSGCCSIQAETPGQPRLVTAIDAHCQSSLLCLQRQYSDPQKVRAVLDYLRLAKTLGTPAADPKKPTENRIQLVLHFSDGTKLCYEQWDNTFLRADNGAWALIDPERGQELTLLLSMLESD